MVPGGRRRRVRIERNYMDRISPVDWQLLCVAPNTMEATFIQGRLQSADIPVRVAGESMAELYGLTFGDLAQVKVYVPAQRWAEAQQLLQAEMDADDVADGSANDATDPEPNPR